ncbi:MAG: phosphoribosylformylglycinamidine synthase, partial [Candidatus Latescibacteria bacterium]|nr:phosphoribosylformylglycinamidine synthase [Candidatus Latescibacterota bacterium]
LLYVVGITRDEMGGSHYYLVRSWIGNQVPKVDPSQGKQLMERLSQATEFGLVRACHDCSEGGIGVACAEMAFAGDLGMEIDLRAIPIDGTPERNDTLLFSESNSRFIVEVPPEYQDKFEQLMSGCSFGQIGKITNIKEFKVHGLEGNIVLSADIRELKETWQSPLRW